MSIEVKNIVKEYGDQKALNDVTFSIAPGEIVGFLGPNGAGKSTMMKILTGYISQTSGQAIVCGLDVQKESTAVKAKVGYLPEHNPLYLDMYVKEYLMFIAGLHKLQNASQKVAEIVDRVGLGLEQHKRIEALSKGYRQRVGLAQAMMHDPDVYILDEPTTGLDPNQIVEIRDVIKSLGSENKTVMLSTHIMQEVEAICDRVLIVNRGNLVANDKASELDKYKRDEVVIKAEFSGTPDVTKLKEISGVDEVTLVSEHMYELRCKTDVRDALFKEAVSQEISILSMAKKTSNLEDIFKTLTTQAD